MDVARIGLEADSRPIEKASHELDEFAGASRRAEAANDERARSHRTSTTATNVSTTATRANTAALHAQATASRAAAFRQRMLAVQSLDVAQSLALGMNPMMVAIQQGGQVAGIYAGQGGVSGAFREAAQSVLGFARAHPVAIAATVALGLATVGLQNELEAASGQSVSLGRVFTATMQELLASVNGVAAPAIALLGNAFSATANTILDGLKLIGDSIINTFDFAIKTVVTLWNGLPGALADIGARAGQAIIDEVVAAINRLPNIVNSVLERAGVDWRMATVQGPTIANDNEGAAAGLMGGLTANYDVFSNSPIGDFIGRVSTRLQTMTATADEAAGALGRTAQAATQAGQPMDLLGQSFDAANDNMRGWQQTFSGFFSDFNNQIQQGASVWDAFKTAGMNALSSIANKLIDMATNNLFASAFGGMGGGGGFLSGLFGSFGLPSFDGGGFTGAGPRSGGVDGRGGFPAILHPNETVYDHMRGAANSNVPQPVTIHQNITVSGTVGLPEIARAVNEGNQFVLSQVDGRSVRAVTKVNRTKPGLIG